MTYLEKLRDPRWQQMRLRVFERDGFACRECGATDKTLHAHHSFYRRNAEPWDYDAPSIITLCEECHEAEGQAAAEYGVDVVQVFKCAGFTASQVRTVTEKLIHILLSSEIRPARFIEKLSDMVNGSGHLDQRAEE